MVSRASFLAYKVRFEVFIDETRMTTSISSEALLPFVARPTDKIFVE